MEQDDACVGALVNACESIIEFTIRLSADQFLSSDLVQSAVIYKLLILGEATKRLSVKFRERHRDFPWQEIAGMRNHLIHRYENIDLLEVWQTCRNDIETMLKKLRNIQSQGLT